MTIDETVAALKGVMGQQWPKTVPLPEEPVIALCEALWVAGHRPTHKTITPYFPGASIRTFLAGIRAWRRSRGFA